MAHKNNILSSFLLVAVLVYIEYIQGISNFDFIRINQVSIILYYISETFHHDYNTTIIIGISIALAHTYTDIIAIA